MTVASAPMPPAGYTRLAKRFHWIVAALMALMFITIWIREETERGSPERAFWTEAHTSLGILVLVVTLARIVTHQPAPPPLGPALAQAAARAMHGMLYLVTLLVPVAGFLRMAAKNRATGFFGFDIPSPTGDAPSVYAIAKALHGEWMQTIVLVLIGLHVAAALWHHVIDRDETLRRMI